MKKKPYLPSPVPQRVIWLNTFASKLAVHAATLGIGPAELALVVAMAAFYSYIVALIDLTRTFTQNLTQYRNLISNAPLNTTLTPVPTLTAPVGPALPATIGIFTYISGLVQRIKGHADYNTAIGEDLGIIGDEQAPFDTANFKPNGEGKAQIGFVNLTFEKSGCDSMHIYTWNGTSFVYLANDTESPYHDTRALAVPGQPENRQFQLRGVLHDAEIGIVSDTITVTFAG
jgi:hypothetical protein